MKLYRTIKETAYSEQVIERSKFICHLKNITTKEEADAFIASVRKEYKDATHNVPSFVIGEKMEIMWQSDDSEPQGTAGAPSLDVLVRQGLTNIACVVTRYFGGIKLGTGGLVKAYQSSVKLAIENAIVCDACEVLEYIIEIDYNTYQKIESLKEKAFTISNRDFQDIVKLSVLIYIEDEESFESFIANISSGKANILKKEYKIDFIEIS